jgi:hypothetical protein
MERKLRSVEELPSDAAAATLDLPAERSVDLLEAHEDGAA